MSPKLTPVLVLVWSCVAFAVAGCRSNKGMDRPSQTTSVRSEAGTVDDYVVRIQEARSPQQEADALRALRKHMTDNGLTYQTRTFRVANNTPVEVASAQGQMVRAEVTLYRGREVVRTFQFVPKDNRNLALLGT
jgi:hypothetical protein